MPDENTTLALGRQREREESEREGLAGTGWLLAGWVGGTGCCILINALQFEKFAVLCGT